MEMQKFTNSEFGSVRALCLDGDVCFVGKDVATILGYSNPRKAIIDHVDEEDKGVTKCDTLGGKQEITVINESGLYSLILSSKLPNAKKFKRWVTSEVLPSIRKHGAYMTEQTIAKALASPDFLIQLANQLKEEQEKNKQLETQVAVNNQIIGELKPKADYTDKILQNKGLVTITQIAKDYGFSGNYMNELLHALKVQFKQSGQWLLYSKYQNCGYTHSETVDIVHSDGRPDIKMNTKWTQKGRLFLYELLKKEGFVPVIER